MNNKVNYFITAIGTDSGKTLASAILCKALNADYWKPVQAGLPRDADIIKSLVPDCTIHPETYLLNTAASPHASAKVDNLEIDLNNFSIPTANKSLIVEGAGGCLVPLNDHDFVIDIPRKLNLPIILVANLYLGSINHTLLTIDYLKRNDFDVKGIIFNGKSNSESERIILKHSDYHVIWHIKEEAVINEEVVAKYAEKIKQKL